MSETDTSRSLSPSSIKTYLICPYSYFLDTCTREAGLPMTGFSARHHWLTESIRRLFPDERYVGPELDDVESLRGADLAKYLRFHSPESFANGTAESWRRHIIQDRKKVHGRDVVWLYENQWWTTLKEIKEIAANYYRFLLEDGPPILMIGSNGTMLDQSVAFRHGDRKFSMRLGPIGKGLVIYNYGSSIGQKALDNDWSVTLDILAFCTLAHEEEGRQMNWGVDPEISETWGGNPIYIDPSVTYVHYDLLHGRRMETHRSDSDIARMSQMISMVEERIRKKEFPAMANRSDCSVCRHNIVDPLNDPVCRKKYPETPAPQSMEDFIGPAHDKQESGQLDLEF
jgi:hypothetical protein